MEGLKSKRIRRRQNASAGLSKSHSGEKIGWARAAVAA